MSGDTAVALPRQQRRIVSALAMAPGVVTREQLQERLGLSRGGLRTSITRIRSSIGAETIVSERDGYRLVVDTIDSAVFEQRVQFAASGTTEERIAALRNAIGLWQGDPLQDVADEEWAQPEVTRLYELRAVAEEDLAELLLDNGRAADAIAVIRTNIARNRFRDRPVGVLLRAMAHEGRHTEALREFQDYRRLLADEIGTEPSGELVAIDRKIALGETFAPVTNFESSDVAHPEDVLPTGMLTYLFTDIEGSTALWTEDASRMSAALERHDEILRESIRSGGGHLVKHTGDGVMAVFKEPAAAARTAINAQQRLDLPVRMGIHCGVATRRGHDYFGRCVSRTARLMSIAHAGQVLLSEDVVPFATSIETLDLGPQLLPGMDRPESAFQLVDPSLQNSFPPLRSSVATPNNLPQPISPLIGRDSEVDYIQHLIDSRRIVSVLGIGGSGKTRLAIEVARSSLDRFRDGVYFVELAPLTDDDHVVDAVSRSMGIKSTSRSGNTPIDNLASTLDGRDVLLVLDNCEHLGAAPALAAESLLAKLPTLHILATSRETLGVSGETVFRTPPLEIDTALKLFIDRCREVQPAFAMTDANLATSRAICLQLDQLPLALELAAAQSVAMNPKQILSRLHRSPDMAGPVKSSADRHRTLRTAIGWSFETLTPDEQRVFRTLSVFAGEFSIEAAEHVCGTAAEAGFGGVAGALITLVTKSLVETNSETGRYRLLQIVQHFAADELARTDDQARARDRHADFFVRRAGELRREVYKAGIQADVSDLANMRKVAEHYLDRGDGALVLQLIVAGNEYWSHAGAATEIASWLERARQTGSNDADLNVRIQALSTVAAALAIARPQGTDALTLGHEAVELSQDDQATARSRFIATSDLGYAYVQSDASDPRGRELLLTSLEHAAGNPVFEMRSYSRLSVAAFIGSDQASGLEPAERAFELASAAGLSVFEKVAQAFRAATRAVLGDRHGAVADLEALQDLPDSLDPVWLGTIHVTAANGWLALDQQELALQHLRPALAIPNDDIGEVIGTMIASTTCMIQVFPPELVAAAIGAVGGFHSASQPMLRDQLSSARARVVELIGAEAFAAASDRGRTLSLDALHLELIEWLNETEV